MRIGFASADWATKALDPLTERPSYGGAGWYRCGLPARELRARGWDVFEGTLIFHKESGTFGVREWPTHDPEAEDAPFQVDLDLIVLQRWMFASVAAETGTARANGQVIVQDVDDHFWAMDASHRAHRVTDPVADAIENRDLYLQGLQKASMVTTSTPYLRDELHRLGVRCPIAVLENHLDVEMFPTLPPSRSDRPIIGWVGAIPWRMRDLDILRGVLGPFVDRKGLHVFHGGHVDVWVDDGKGSKAIDLSQTFSHQAGVDPTRVGLSPMVPIYEYPELFERMDVGLVPLRDVPFNRAKSWVKGLEYAASGVPFVASDVAEYRRLHDRLGIGRLAKRPKDWVRHLTELLDPDTRLWEATRNREAVKALDIRQAAHRWEAVYLEALAAS